MRFSKILANSPYGGVVANLGKDHLTGAIANSFGIII